MCLGRARSQGAHLERTSCRCQERKRDIGPRDDRELQSAAQRMEMGDSSHQQRSAGTDAPRCGAGSAPCVRRHRVSSPQLPAHLLVPFLHRLANGCPSRHSMSSTWVGGSVRRRTGHTLVECATAKTPEPGTSGQHFSPWLAHSSTRSCGPVSYGSPTRARPDRRQTLWSNAATWLNRQRSGWKAWPRSRGVLGVLGLGAVHVVDGDDALAAGKHDGTQCPALGRLAGVLQCSSKGEEGP